MADQIDDQHGNQGAQETEQDNQQERCISLKMAESVNDRGGQCDIQKNECQNPVTWDPKEGLLFGEKEKEELFTELAKPYISGITFSGGDPLHAANEAEILALAKDIRSRFPGKTIWMYTGYDWEYVKTPEVARWIDVLVDGPYKKDLRDTQLHWRGSSNQHVIEVPESLASGKMVLHCA